MTPTSRQAYVERLRLWVPGARREAEGLLDSWLADLAPEPLSGLQQPPALPIHLALAEGFLAREDGDEALADAAARRLAGYGCFAEAYPRHLIPDRPEFAGGLPAQPNFFHLSTMAEAYLGIRESAAVTDDQHRAIRGILAESCDLIFSFPEWGAHNRAAIRAWGLLAAARACDDDRRAPRWERMARELMADSLEGWTIEDAMHYHSMWTQAILGYVDLAGGEAAFFRQPTSRFYFEYYLNLLCPIGGVADFGDSWWGSNLPKYLPIFERGAREYGDGCLRWAAGEVFGRLMERHGPGPFGDPVIWVQAANWVDESVEPRAPTWGGREVLDELAGKKVVFRSGWSRQDTFLLLNYKPDTDYGRTQRDYLEHTIPVEAEKAHHGHADENSISTLTSRGALLLHDGGYRERLPNGQYRADLYHNRVVARNELMREGESLYDFLHNDGRYRPVETSRIDYRRFSRVEFSRTRLVDRGAGYLHDRVVAWLLDEEMFLVIDGIQALRDDVFTFSNLYHTQRVLDEGEGWFDTAVDSVRTEPGGEVYAAPENAAALAVICPPRPWFWQGQEPVRRHWQEEILLHQTTSGRLAAGKWVVFYSALAPHDRGEDPAAIAARIRVADVDRSSAAGLVVDSDRGETLVGVKFDREEELLMEDVRPRYTWDSGRTRYGWVETDARFVWSRRRERSVSYACTEAMRLDCGGTTLLEAPSYQFTLQYAGPKVRDSPSKWRAWEEEDVALPASRYQSTTEPSSAS